MCCHKFARRWTLEEHERWFRAHEQEIIDGVMRKLAETQEAVEKLEATKAVSQETMRRVVEI